MFCLIFGGYEPLKIHLTAVIFSSVVNTKTSERQNFNNTCFEEREFTLSEDTDVGFRLKSVRIDILDA